MRQQRCGTCAAGRITGLTQQLWALRSVTGPDGVTLTQGFFTPVAWQVGYDRRNRITSFARAQAAVRYTYDANGKRVSEVQANTSDIDLDGDIDGFDSTRRVQRISIAVTSELRHDDTLQD